MVLEEKAEVIRTGTAQGLLGGDALVAGRAEGGTRDGEGGEEVAVAVASLPLPCLFLSLPHALLLLVLEEKHQTQQRGPRRKQHRSEGSISYTEKRRVEQKFCYNLCRTRRRASEHLCLAWNVEFHIMLTFGTGNTNTLMQTSSS